MSNETETPDVQALNKIRSIRLSTQASNRIQEERKRRSFPGQSFLEPIAAIGTGIAAEIGGGLSGIGAELMGGDGVSMIESFRRQTYQPQSEGGQKNLERIGNVFQAGLDAARVPLSGIAGLVELATGQGTQQAANTVSSVRENGLGPTMGNRVFEETGNPLAATIARVLPEGTAEATGLGLGPRIARNAAGATSRAVSNTPQLIERIPQTPGRQRIAQEIQQGSTDRDTARYVLQDRGRIIEGEIDNGGSPPSSTLPAPDNTNLPPTIARPRVQRNRSVDAAIKSGFDEGLFPYIRESSGNTRNLMLEMVDVMEKSKNNSGFSILNRPSDIVGNRALERYRHVLSENRSAANQLDEQAAKLRGQQVDAQPVVNKFLSELESRLGVTLGDDLKPVFQGSDIQGLSGPENVINRLINRMSEVERLDAFEVHRLKRFIDENVNFGANAEGLSGRTEALLKGFRRDLDSLLDNNFPEYDSVNTIYAETREALDSLQDVAGTKIDLAGENADKAVGVLMRRLLSNAQSRIQVLDSINLLDSTAKKYGADFDDDLLALTMFSDQLDQVFGTTAKTSFQGQIRQSLPTSGRDLLGRVVERAADSLRGDGQKAAFTSIREAINSFQ